MSVRRGSVLPCVLFSQLVKEVAFGVVANRNSDRTESGSSGRQHSVIKLDVMATL